MYREQERTRERIVWRSTYLASTKIQATAEGNQLMDKERRPVIRELREG